MRLVSPYYRFMQLVGVAFFATLTACAQLGLATPQTFNERLVVGYASVTQVRETATVLLDQKKISSEDATHAQTTANIARMALDTARKMHDVGDTTGAGNKLTAVVTTLSAVQAYLATRSK